MLPTLPKPRSTNDFNVAIVCASPLEAEMVQHLFDLKWVYEEINFEQARGDRNTYRLGTIGKRHVVLVILRGKGSINAAIAVPGLRASFSNIEIVFAVGRCGVVPQYTTTEMYENVFLGDCIVSTGIVQYDFGRQYPEAFARKTGIEDNLGHQNLAIQALIAEIQIDSNLTRILDRTVLYLGDIQRLTSKAAYPGAHKDCLFDTSYLHTHHDNSEACELCWTEAGVCTKSCDALGCQEVIRQRSVESETVNSDRSPRLHFHRFGSGSAVIQSGTYRDQLAMNNNIIAFEMEGAGLWNSLPMIIVKSGCNYADSHKSKEWQPYAAAVAAAAMKSILDIWKIIDVIPKSSFQTSGDASLESSAATCH